MRRVRAPLDLDGNIYNVSTADLLVVEDDPEMRAIVGAYGELAGFEAATACDGATALKKACAHPPSLIVLDLMLPDLSGYEVCKRLRAEARTREVPVLMLTALGDDESRARALACGATAFVTKPFDPDTLMEKMLETCARSPNGELSKQ